MQRLSNPLGGIRPNDLRLGDHNDLIAGISEHGDLCVGVVLERRLGGHQGDTGYFSPKRLL